MEESVKPNAASLGSGIQAVENEYRRLAQQLSDGPGQLLANAVFELRSAKQLMRVDMEAAEQGLDALLDELQQGLADLQQMVYELQPALLEEMGLEPALRRYVRNFEQRTGISVDLHLPTLPERLPPTLEITLFRVVQECLRNIDQHARADAVSLRLENGVDDLTLIVEDNGVGFKQNVGAERVPRTGWLSIRNRAAVVRGELHAFDRADGGMRITLTVPYEFDEGHTT